VIAETVDEEADLVPDFGVGTRGTVSSTGFRDPVAVDQPLEPPIHRTATAIKHDGAEVPQELWDGFSLCFEVLSKFPQRD
jgi:hypothetical protein